MAGSERNRSWRNYNTFTETIILVNGYRLVATNIRRLLSIRCGECYHRAVNERCDEHDNRQHR